MGEKQRKRRKQNANFHLDPDLMDEVRAAAAANCRSVARELEFRLRRDFDRETKPSRKK